MELIYTYFIRYSLLQSISNNNYAEYKGKRPKQKYQCISIILYWCVNLENDSWLHFSLGSLVVYIKFMCDGHSDIACNKNSIECKLNS